MTHAAPMALRAGTIRRVVRRGQIYICGLCRSHHQSEGEAVECVQTCWALVLSYDPVIERRRPLGRVFRCRFCARDYGRRHEAESCAVDCRTTFDLRFEEEQELLNQMPLPPNRRRPRRLVNRAPTAQRPFPAKPKLTPKSKAAPQPDATQPAETQVAAPAPAVATAPVAAAAPAAAEAKTKKDKDPAGAFYRDGARYVCKTCNTKYFTKNEVITCFNSHASA